MAQLSVIMIKSNDHNYCDILQNSMTFLSNADKVGIMTPRVCERDDTSITATAVARLSSILPLGYP